MNTLLANATLLLMLALTLFPGCASMTGGGSAGGGLARWVADLRDVATVGASIDLLDHPGHRDAYVKTIAALDVVTKLQTVSPLELHAALAHLPIKELRGEKAILYVTAAQILMRRALDGREPVAVPAAVREVAAALRDGLRAAVGS